jgi:hypothetical protein
MKKKFWAIALIGLLLVTGLVFAGCDIKICPGNGDCIVYFTGTGSGVNIHSRTGCGDENCIVYNIKSASYGYSSDMRCNNGHGCRK